ncbi:UvrD-helicase domain-containing protein [Paenibacillus motobuensis]|uniref:RNA polymerase recycling motor HelD n=1 Tax=Paenibacillus TaxID=44249 RepID=UPI00203F841A|nr:MULTISPECIES: RNA polymerase recycling motor HelD [Paenibacillus]MCM3038349.1 UvrD-helicase domain-containing protein [Paenibacillus lutimineralis]MCM3645453.1 UvrD-helicase domain-containing protein [Paenibacillus motobuensis]
MSNHDKERQAEQNRVEYVEDQIGTRISRLESEVGTIRGDVVSMRKDFWDEVTVNFSEADDVGETSTSLRQQSEVLSEREKRHQLAYNSLVKLKRLQQSPYFGRIDFAEQGENGEAIYLGIASLLEEDDETFLIYDWRAPISNLYYDSVPGPASYETPSGTIEGEMTLKRQFVIRGRDLKVMFDTGVTIGDELLQQVLGRSSDAQMKSIVATIQKEQNRIIRNDTSRMLIVQGAAGSGKTSAALQRVAYLLYKHRDTLRADQMILFSPNPMFNSYVSTVLPELGEENMLQTTFQEYLERRLGREFQLEDPFVQIEYVLSGEEDDSYQARMNGIRYKSSLLFFEAIGRYKALLEQKGMKFKPLRFMGREVVGAEAISERFYAYDPAITLANRCELLKEWMLKEIAAFGKEEVNQPWVEDQIQLLDTEDYQRAYQRMRRQHQKSNSQFSEYEEERTILGRMVVSERLKPLRKWIKSLRFVDVTKLYCQLFEQSEIAGEVHMDALPEDWSLICGSTISKIKAGELFYEDITPFLYLKEMILGFHSNHAIRHVIIDEAQDYSPFQLFFLKRLFPRARMTALGDLNQAIYAHSSVLQQSSVLTDLYGSDNSEQIVLQQSYRSTREIVEFTRGMLPGGEAIIPFNRAGEKPEVIVVQGQDDLYAQIKQDVTALRNEGYESIAVICKTAEESKEVHEHLAKDLEARLIKKTTLSFEKGVHIIPAYLAKGVEFDAVLIFDGSNNKYTRESERKLFYTACTRAMHLLHVYSAGKPSRFITETDPKSFVRK